MGMGRATETCIFKTQADASTPVLQYYNLSEDMKLQCDASQAGLGAAFTKEGNLYLRHQGPSHPHRSGTPKSRNN